MPSKNGLGIDVGTTGGSWLFKQGELLLGPVPFPKLLELLYEGQVDGATMVAPEGEPFQPIAHLQQFKVHLAKARAKLRVEAQSVEKNQRERRSHLLRLTLIGLVTLVVLFAGGRLAAWLAIHRPWEKQIQLPEPLITEELPTIKLASARSVDELAYPDVKHPQRPGPVKPDNKLPDGKKPPRPGPGQPPTPNPKPASDDVQMQQQWDQEAISGVIRSSKTSLHPCLNAEAHRQKPGWQARVPIEFTIGNDGHVSKLWIDNPDYKDESNDLFKCMFTELRKWKFPTYSGEQANVSLAFTIRSAPK
jgi:hypothetical protein